jgi:hypothetical protein
MKNIVKLGGLFLLLAGYQTLKASDWTFTLPSPAKAGAVVLNSGEYKISMRGSVAVITDAKSEKSYTAMAKVVDAENKFENTMVATSKRDGELKITSLSIAGTKTKIVFE